MSEGPKPRRRWLRFSLRTGFLLFTVICVWIGWNVHRVRQRQVFLAFLAQTDAGVYSPDLVPIKPWKRLPWMWSLLGAKPIGAIQVRTTLFSETDRQYVEALFPEASVVTQ